MPKYISVWYGMPKVHYSQYHTYMRAKSPPSQAVSITFHHASRKHKGRRTTIADGSPAVLGEEKVSNAVHDVVSQEVCARGAGIKTAV